MPFIIPCVCVASPPVPAGVFGLFYNRLGNNQNTTQKYTYASDAVSSGTSLAFSQVSGAARAAVNNSVTALFAGGIGVSPAASNEVQKYTLASDAVAAGTNLTIARGAPNGASNKTVAIISGGDNPNVTSPAVTSQDKYIYSGDTVLATGALASAKDSGVGAGSGTVALFAGGNGAGSNKITNKYTYATEATVGGTNLNTDRNQFAGVYDGTTNVVMAGGFNTGLAAGLSSTEKYKLSDDTVVAGTALTETRFSSGDNNGTNSGTYMLIGAGSIPSGTTATTRKYTYSGDTVSSGTNLTTATSDMLGT